MCVGKRHLFFLWYQGFNLQPCACQARAYATEPNAQPHISNLTTEILLQNLAAPHPELLTSLEASRQKDTAGLRSPASFASLQICLPACLTQPPQARPQLQRPQWQGPARLTLPYCAYLSRNSSLSSHFTTTNKIKWHKGDSGHD